MMTPAEYEAFSRACALEVADVQAVYVEGQPYFWSLYHFPDCFQPLNWEDVVGQDYITSFRLIRASPCK